MYGRNVSSEWASQQYGQSCTKIQPDNAMCIDTSVALSVCYPNQIQVLFVCFCIEVCAFFLPKELLQFVQLKVTKRDPVALRMHQRQSRNNKF